MHDFQLEKRGEKMELKVMTFNIRVHVPQDGSNAWPYRIEKVSKIILDHSPLVIGTQEGSLHMLEDIGKRLPDYRWTGQGRRGGMKDEFCAVFYKYNLIRRLKFIIVKEKDKNELD
ncbi:MULTISPECIES: endonuclease/exonuclease/phosphatase family protein [Bacillus]|uniref:endonuclease/exonuclease/phosphatase family protein n=1 Tax=Bacillus TaxID=1386 RepID=UPI000BB72498|nr:MULTISPECIES: endonuclease/exonuclease/phosphatase family protein [Bacillus]